MRKLHNLSEIAHNEERHVHSLLRVPIVNKVVQGAMVLGPLSGSECDAPVTGVQSHKITLVLGKRVALNFYLQ